MAKKEISNKDHLLSIIAFILENGGISNEDKFSKLVDKLCYYFNKDAVDFSEFPSIKNKRNIQLKFLLFYRFTCYIRI